MTLECINPPDLPTPDTYTQVVVAKGTKLIFVSGQEPEDIDGKLVGRDDFAAQVRQVFANLGRALAAAGALPEHVAKITIYVVDYQRDDHYPIVEAARGELPPRSKGTASPLPPVAKRPAGAPRTIAAVLGAEGR